LVIRIPSHSHASSFLVDFDGVLANKTRTPYTLKEFKQYLQSQYCDENMDFLQEVNEFKAHPSKEKAEEIIKKFILTDSPRQVNVSEIIRANVEKSIGESQLNVHIFDTTFREIHELLRKDAFQRFVSIQSSSNICDTEIKNRRLSALMWFAISITLTLSLWLANNGNISRYYRLFTFIPNLMGVGALFTAYAKICPQRAFKAIRMVEDQSQKLVVDEKLQDETVIHLLRPVAIRVGCAILVITILLTAFCVLLGIWNK